jgi:glycosyltransferase involved in cell wall biosynthesis
MHQLGRRRRFMFDYRRRASQLRAAYGDDPPAIVHSWLFEGNTVALTAARHWPGTRVVIAQRSGTMERSMRGHMLLMRRLYRHADRALANSADGAELLADLGVERSKILVIPQGVPDERIAVTRSPAEVKRELGFAPEVPMVVAVGRADDTKDWPSMLGAMAVVWRSEPRCRLVVVGPTAAEMSALGVEMPEQAEAVGWQGNVADFMNAADAVAISSWTEGNSNVAAEALRLGVPVACTDTGEHPAAVRQAGGRVVPIRRPDQLGLALLELLSDPPSREYVREVADRILSVEASVDATLEVYAELVGEPSRRPSAAAQASTIDSRS